MNSSGSVTPVKNTASTVDKNMDLYLSLLSGSTLLYIARAKPEISPVAPIICPTLKRAGVTVVRRFVYAAMSPAFLKLIRSFTHASHKGSCPNTLLPAFTPVMIS